MQGKAIVLSGGVYNTKSAKTTHGLIRGSERFEVVAVIDPVFYGQDAGILLDGRKRNIPVYSSVQSFLDEGGEAAFCVVGVAPKGGKLPEEMRVEVITALSHGISVVSGLHQFLGEDPELSELAKLHLADIYDIRKPRSRKELNFWTGAIYQVKCPVIAVMGTDCGLGKRTTAKMIVEAFRSKGFIAEMIYTGQTGWMQGWKYGFILDSTYNDFVSGELEYMIVKCWEDLQPDIIVLEGQAALRNPSGPCGAEFLISGNLQGVVLQHAPARKYYDGFEHLGLDIPPLDNEIQLISAYKVPVLAVSLNTKGLSLEEAKEWKNKYHIELDLPVCLPVEEGVDEIIPVLSQLIKHEN